jgi:hypothetical protein
MNLVLMVAMATTSQCFPPPPMCGPPVVVRVPSDYVYIELDGMIERTRRYEVIEYANGNKKVPVINGIVPDVKICENRFGDREIFYDYSRRTRLDECYVCEPLRSPKKIRKPEPDPISQPQPQAIPQRKLQESPAPPPFEPYDPLPRAKTRRPEPKPEPVEVEDAPRFEPAPKKIEDGDLRKPSDVPEPPDDYKFGKNR